MRTTSIPRRHFLLGTAALIGASGVVVKAIGKSCVAPDGSDSSLRESLHYVQAAPDPTQQCKACTFFSEPAGECGKCAIFNGPADATGHCDSWAKRS